MWGAVHGDWCGTRTWPTRCPTCATPVYFFMCNCGCKVFFDELGPPWPLHDCDTSWTRNLKKTTDRSGRITVELAPGISITRPPERDFGIDDTLAARARASSKAQKPDPFVAVEPRGEKSRLIIGVVREVAHDANPIKAMKLPDTVMAHAMLGPIGAQAVGRLTIHAPSPAGGPQESITTWIPTALLSDSRIVRGITVAARVEGIHVAKFGYTWFCDEFEVVG